jgi:hypothetical protein
VAELGLRSRKGGAAERETPRLAAALLPLLALPAQEFSFARSLANAVRHHRAGEPAAAEQAARAILEHADELGLAEGERAKAQFAVGVIAATAAAGTKDPGKAEALRVPGREAFSAARALAGPGELRADATYDLGVIELQHAEAVRATIPEISGQPAPAPPAAPGGPPPPGSIVPPSEPPDPLVEARKLYGAARTWLVERLRLDWGDEDTRANLELIQRRLRQLDEIEKQREQQKQQDDEQQGQDKDQNDKDQKDQKDQKGEQDPKDAQDKQGKDDQDQDRQDQEKKDQEKKDPQAKDDEQEKEGEKKPEEQQAQPEEGEEAKEQQAQPGEEKPEQQAERVLTREQVMQLLDKLAELEKQQKALEAALRAKRRAAAKRDW